MINTVHPHNLPQVSVKYSNSLSCLNDDTLGRLFDDLFGHEGDGELLTQFSHCT